MKLGPISIGESRHDSVTEALTVVREQLVQAEGNEELLTERLAELELGLEDLSWMRWGMYAAEREFSREGLYKLMRLARLMYLKNPLINRAVSVKVYYVWGGGVTIRALNETVNETVQAFVDDPKNQAALTGHQARTLKEIDLETTGNLFFVLFTNASTGRVRVRAIDADEINNIVTNPDDATEPRFYRRVWNAMDFDVQTGDQPQQSRQGYYPDWRYRPAQRPAMIAGTPVYWDSPVYHVKTGGLPMMRFGVPEIYSALDWARAAKDDLEDYATMRRALSRFAWRLTATGGKNAIAAAKTKLATTLASSTSLNVETNPPPLTGSTFIGTKDGTTMEPISTRGAGPNPEDARRMWLMVCAAVGLPETFMGDASIGNHATSKTLDRPTELQMVDRQTLWSHVFREILSYVVLQAVKAPSGPLHGLGSIEVDLEDGSESVAWGSDDEGEIDGSVEVTFPSLLEHDVTSRVAAIVQAATLSGFQPAGTLDPATLSKLLLQALGVEDVDAALAELFPDDREPEADMLPLDPIRRRQALTMDLANKIVAPSTAAARLGYDAGEPAKAAGEKGNLGDALLAQFEKGDQGDEADPQT